MKYFIFIALVFLFNNSFAATTFRFLPLNRNAMAMIRSSVDNDFADLYSLMNVPEQDSSLGKGKGLKSADKGFTMTCSRDKALCDVILNQSVGVKIDPAAKCMSFSAMGNSAEEMKKLFVQNSKGEVHYLTSDNLFRINADNGTFVFEACQNGF
jgi:hypothetical protein